MALFNTDIGTDTNTNMTFTATPTPAKIIRAASSMIAETGKALRTTTVPSCGASTK
jgi:hypothetical protein